MSCPASCARKQLTQKCVFASGGSKAGSPRSTLQALPSVKKIYQHLPRVVQAYKVTLPGLGSRTDHELLVLTSEGQPRTESDLNKVCTSSTPTWASLRGSAGTHIKAFKISVH